MKSKVMPWILGGILVLVLAAGLLLPLRASADPLQATNVANLTTVNVLTVPAGFIYHLHAVIIANPNATTSGFARIFRTGAAVTSFISVAAGRTEHLSFPVSINFGAGTIVQVRNGASAGTISFTLIGNFTQAP